MPPVKIMFKARDTTHHLIKYCTAIKLLVNFPFLVSYTAVITTMSEEHYSHLYEHVITRKSACQR